MSGGEALQEDWAGKKLASLRLVTVCVTRSFLGVWAYEYECLEANEEAIVANAHLELVKGKIVLRTKEKSWLSSISQNGEKRPAYLYKC